MRVYRRSTLYSYRSEEFIPPSADSSVDHFLVSSKPLPGAVSLFIISKGIWRSKLKIPQVSEGDFGVVWSGRPSRGNRVHVLGKMFLIDHLIRSFLDDFIGSVGGSSTVKVDDGCVLIEDVRPAASKTWWCSQLDGVDSCAATCMP